MEGKVYDKDGRVRMTLSGKWNEQLTAQRVDESGSADGAPMQLWRRPPFDWLHPTFKYNRFVQEKLCDMDAEALATLPENDSRKRADRMYLEQGDLERAGAAKHAMEEKQRAEERARKAAGEQWVPVYFKQTSDAKYGSTWVEQGDYWGKRQQRIDAYRAAHQADSTVASTGSV
eukprot:TRINITY_DN11820_c0_g1_i1.p2 TRINITY_DN11820_c0_g1~~TRINITY_DN11820_c0_g1_i1.p2  ORF type:complete len:204 (-),score=59.40 TRINITY_DN11820_c0_g1_i1:45-566(-)